MMKRKHRYLLAFGLISVLIVGLVPTVTRAQADVQNPNEQYKELLNGIDDMIRSRRLGREVSTGKVENVEILYNSIFSSDGEVQGLFTEIKSSSEPDVDVIRDLRELVAGKAESQGYELPFLYENAIFIILGITIGLAITVNMISRTMVDWEEVNQMKKKQEELKDKLEKAKEENDTKRVHKLQQKNQQFMQENMGTMMSPMKTMLIIFIPFIIVLNLLSSTYSGWVVAWLPFKLPWPDIDFFLLSRFFSGDVAGLGYFGWYILSYFGLSQIFRKVLVPSR